MPNRLAQYLTESGVSQAEFGRLAGISSPMICEYVSGKRRPGLDAAFAIERASGGEVPASYWTSIAPITGDRQAV
jgi:transcriptional regulator with XRE-family HTH domain